MYINCIRLIEAGIVPKGSCCGSCHDDADDGWDWEMCGIYEDDIVPGRNWGVLVGSVCCGVRNKFANSDPRIKELLSK